MDTDNDGSVNSGVDQADKWSEYIDKFVPGSFDGADMSDEAKDHLKQKPIFLPRYLLDIVI